MKKKKKTTKPKRQQKIDVVLDSLLNLERVVKELVAQIEQLKYSQSRFKDVEIDPKKYWPNTEPPFKYKDIMWNDNDTRQWDAIEKGLQ
jgi:hypothetical protein